MLVLGVPGLLNILHSISMYLYLFGGPLWPYTYAPALAKNLVSEH